MPETIKPIYEGEQFGINKAMEAAIRALFASNPEARVHFMVIAQQMREDYFDEDTSDPRARPAFDRLVAYFAPGQWPPASGTQ